MENTADDPKKKELFETNAKEKTKHKFQKPFIAMLILAIIFLLTSGLLGYLFIKKSHLYQDLSSEKQLLQNKLNASSEDLQQKNESLQKENDDLKKENEQLAKDKKTLEDNAKTTNDKITAYTAFLNYLAEITQKHNGYEGWRDAEYQQGRALAQATGDQDFITTVDSAWNQQELSQIVRLVRVLQGIVSGINNNL
jgi:cell division protein FtsB